MHIYSGHQNVELDGILARTEFVRCEMPVKCLGIPLAAQWLWVIIYSPLMDQIANCISKWTTKSLSFAGRLELIYSIIQGVEYFWLQVFPLPVTVIEKIHRLYRNFLWNSRRAPVAWEEICHHKEEGGLGIRHIQSWNVVLLARVSWNIHRKAETLLATRTDLGSSKRRICGPCASTPRNRPGTFSLSVRSATSFGHVSDNSLALAGVCPPFIVQSSGSRRRKLVPPCRTKRDTSLWHARSTPFGGINEVIFEGSTPYPEGFIISVKITLYRLLLTLLLYGLIVP
ncbi:UNVERIFIED_CONTAM: hypothetical protein Sindi_0998300 [Sesamum indicum]